MNSVFPIMRRLDNESDKLKIIASGFFIDNLGYFVTTGHTFKDAQPNDKKYFICFPEEEIPALIPIIDFEILYKRTWVGDEANKFERTRERHQYGYEFKDIAVGRVPLLNTPLLSFQEKRPFKKSKLKPSCYNKHPINCNNGILSITDNLKNLFEYCNKPYFLKHRITKARIPIWGVNIKNQDRDLYNNCIEVEGSNLKGNSGGPVLNERGEVIGIILGGDRYFKDSITNLLLSKYVKKKADVLKYRLKEKAAN